jgi:carboxypeptidase D
MTWNGQQGFSKAPSDPFFTPYNPSIGFVIEETENQPIPATPVGIVAGGGIMGVTRTERGLTWVTVNLAGHEIPQYVPSASYRQLEFLLGRIDSLTQMGDFTTQSGNYTGTTPPSPDYSDEEPSESSSAPASMAPSGVVSTGTATAIRHRRTAGSF